MTPAAPVPTVVGADEQDQVELDLERWVSLAVATLSVEGESGELTLTFVDEVEIASLNEEHMGQSGATDVLSFPLDAAELSQAVASAGPRLLGDVVICPSVAAAAAPSHAGTLEDELALLVVHGILHVLGHDHADAGEAEAMRARELDLLSALFWRGTAPAGFLSDQPPR